ncbi:MAG: beta-lactamase family protein [Clostridiales bacterium]|nr:beta-lactamase family protein [Clostridiales bacterium]
MAELSPFLKNCAAFINENALNVIRVSEAYGNGEINTVEFMPVSPCQDVYSVAKTFTMTGVGLLFDKGLLRLDEKICDILADELPESGMDDRWFASTVEMALTHRLGLPGGFLDIDVNPSWEFTNDFLRYLFTYPLAYEPDTESRYSDGAYYLLSRIVEKKAGLPLDDFLWKEMLTKLEVRELAWSHCPQGHPIGATGLYVHSSDMAKLGLVYLNDGLYKGRRILSKEWTQLAVAREFALNRYGRKSAYGKGGMYGQELLVVPYQDRVIAIQSFSETPDEFNDFVGRSL